MGTLKAILDFIKKNGSAIFIIAAVVVAMLWLSQCNRANRLKDELDAEKQRTQQNIAALTSQLQTYTNAVGQGSYQKPIAQMSIEEIKKNFPLL
ncbi:MAG: hypothetical protein V1679_00310, partial [Candidatus Peregrinibacteria bacterium]